MGSQEVGSLLIKYTSLHLKIATANSSQISLLSFLALPITVSFVRTSTKLYLHLDQHVLRCGQGCYQLEVIHASAPAKASTVAFSDTTAPPS